MNHPEDLPSMEQVIERYRVKLEAKDADFKSKAGGLRQAAAISGIERWTHEHTVGAVFSATSMQAGAHLLHSVGAISHGEMDAIVRLADEQAIIALALEQD